MTFEQQKSNFPGSSAGIVSGPSARKEITAPTYPSCIQHSIFSQINIEKFIQTLRPWWSFQVVNVDNPNWKDNTVAFSCFEAKDYLINIKFGLEGFKIQIKESTWQQVIFSDMGAAKFPSRLHDSFWHIWLFLTYISVYEWDNLVITEVYLYLFTKNIYTGIYQITHLMVYSLWMIKVMAYSCTKVHRWFKIMVIWESVLFFL